MHVQEKFPFNSAWYITVDESTVVLLCKKPCTDGVQYILVPKCVKYLILSSESDERILSACVFDVGHSQPHPIFLLVHSYQVHDGFI